MSVDKVFDALEASAGRGITVDPNGIVDVRDGKTIRRDPTYKDPNAPRVVPALQRTPETDAISRVYSIRNAVKNLKKSGYTIPKVVADALANWESLRKGTDNPTPPDFKLPPSEFADAFQTYMKALTVKQQEQDAARSLAPRAYLYIQSACEAGLGELIDQIRPEFQDCAKVFEETRLRLYGIDSLADAASADLTGDMVRAWHDRDRAGKRMSAIFDDFKLFASALTPLGWDTVMVLLVFAPVKKSHLGHVASAVKSAPVAGHLKRFEALAENGYTLNFVSSAEELRERFRVLSGSASFDDDDDDDFGDAFVVSVG